MRMCARNGFYMFILDVNWVPVIDVLSRLASTFIIMLCVLITCFSHWLYKKRQDECVHIMFYQQTPLGKYSQRSKETTSKCTVNSFILRKYFTCEAVIPFIEQQIDKRINAITFRAQYGEAVVAICSGKKKSPTLCVEVSEETLDSLFETIGDIGENYIL